MCAENTDGTKKITNETFRLECLNKAEEIREELRHCVERSIGEMREFHSSNFGSTKEYIMESMIGTFWGILLQSCEDLCETFLSVESIEKICIQEGLRTRFVQSTLVINLLNHDYGFTTSDTGAYGGPQSRDGKSTGGLCCMMTPEELLKFMTVFDTMVPEFMEYVNEKLQDAWNTLKASEILMSSVNVAISPFVWKWKDRYEISVSGACPDITPPTVEITFYTRDKQDFRLMSMTLAYYQLIERPNEWIELGCRSFDNPELAARNKCIQFFNMDE